MAQPKPRRSRETIADGRSREEIVDAIIGALKPLNVRISPEEIWGVVQQGIDYLFASVAQKRRPTIESKEAAKKLEKPLHSLIRALKEIPPNNTLARPDLLEDLLDFEDLRADLAANSPSGNLDETKTFCAATALAIITLCSQKRAGRNLMQEIAALLHELITKKADADMTRACNKWVDMIRAAGKRGIPADQILAESVMNGNVDIPLVALMESLAR